MMKSKSLTKTIATRLKKRLKKIYKYYVKRDPFAVNVAKWFKDDGDNSLRLNYPLNENSIVFDAGGYEGQWAQDIWDRYQSNIYVFEPVPDFAEKIAHRFSDNSKIKVLPFGLAGDDGFLTMSMQADGSSAYRDAGNSIEIPLKDIEVFMTDNSIDHIDLIKINIEGGEFPLLKKMIDSNLVKKCTDLQIQFHEFYPNAWGLRDDIRAELAKTHELTYDYTFVWENWRKKLP